MKNSDYWKKRGELTQNILLQKADRFIDDMERSYKEAYNSIENEINVFFQRFAVNEGLSMNDAKKLLNSNEIEKFKMTVEEYIKKGQENAISNMWQKELESASNLYRIDRLKSLQIQINQQIEMLSAYKNIGTEKTLKDIFEESYYRNIFDVQQFLGYGKAFEILDTKTINSAIIKPWTYDGETFSQRIWKDNNKLKYSLDKILTQGIIRGSPPDKISKSIAKEMNTSLSNARRLVLTESAVFSTKGREKSYDKLNVDEIEFVASLDEKTCAECGGMDGKHYPRSTGEIGKNLPPLHPYCRCTTAPYFNDEFTEGEERFARDEKGNGYYVPSDMTYNDWLNLKVINKNDKINKKTPFEPAKTIKEAEKFAKDILKISNVSYKGVDITTANSWNEGLKDTFERFPELRNNFGFVGEAHERNAMLKPILKQYYIDELIKRNPSFSVLEIEPYADKQVRIIMKKLQVGKSTYAQSWSPKNEPFANFKGVSVNKFWGNKSDIFIKELSSDVSSKFHPVGCDTIRSVLDHEIGHQLDDLLNISDIKEVQDLFNNKTQEELTNALSRYAWDNDNNNKYGEMIAEAWAEYCNNPEPREVAKIIGEIIEKEYYKKFSL